ncbi:MAG: DinB family protein [Anaerolineae bacterium]|nr:DinB family protein [Anaerolineae bacterium]
MDANTRETLTVPPVASRDPAIGRALWRLEDGRVRTLETLDGLSDDLVDRHPADESSIGTILYHIALIEADWLHTEVLEQELPADMASLFPLVHRDAAGNLTAATGYTLAQHLDRLGAVRARLLDVYQAMDGVEFRRLRSLPDYDVTPEWVLHHLTQHEAEHRGQIGALRSALERL